LRALYDLPDNIIGWLVEEQFFFHNAIPSETREFLKGFGFLGAGLVQDPKEQTEAPTLVPSESSTPTTGSESVSVPSVGSPEVVSARLDTTPAVKTA
jgi:hypothetical protein